LAQDIRERLSVVRPATGGMIIAASMLVMCLCNIYFLPKNM
jgi:hypothetical protein